MRHSPTRAPNSGRPRQRIRARPSSKSPGKLAVLTPGGASSAARSAGRAGRDNKIGVGQPRPRHSADIISPDCSHRTNRGTRDR